MKAEIKEGQYPTITVTFVSEMSVEDAGELYALLFALKNESVLAARFLDAINDGVSYNTVMGWQHEAEFGKGNTQEEQNG